MLYTKHILRQFERARVHKAELLGAGVTVSTGGDHLPMASITEASGYSFCTGALHARVIPVQNPRI